MGWLKASVVLLMLSPGWGLAQDWDLLKEEGVHAIMRHALAPGVGDPGRFQLGDCTTQRNLDARGRAEAEAIGAALREAGISFDGVHASQWCRTMETAELLGLGPVEETPALNSFFQDRSSSAAQTADVKELILGAGGKLMLVTHQVNISALTGQGTGSGEILVIRLEDGEVEVLESISVSP
ncbi:MAG: histidine phosphatase family protein [Sulfitobacter sp.]|nr:histidine phosphatase family protein [Sulfitobacter sp.]